MGTRITYVQNGSSSSGSIAPKSLVVYSGGRWKKGYNIIKASNNDAESFLNNQTVKAESDKLMPTEQPVTPARLLNALGGATLSVCGDFLAEHELIHNYEFDNIIPTKVQAQVGAYTWESATDENIFIPWQDGWSTGIYLNRDGTLTLVAAGGYSGSINREVSAATFSSNNKVAKEVTDNFIANTYGICFGANTKILVSEHDYKNIEDIKIGDQVLTYDLNTHELHSTRVVGTRIQNAITDVVEVIFESGNSIRLTSTHAIYTQDGWKIYIPTNNTNYQTAYSVGDRVLQVNGEYDTIINIIEENVPQPVYHISIKNGDTLVATENNIIVEPEMLPTPVTLTDEELQNLVAQTATKLETGPAGYNPEDDHHPYQSLAAGYDQESTRSIAMSYEHFHPYE